MPRKAKTSTAPSSGLGNSSAASQSILTSVETDFQRDLEELGRLTNRVLIGFGMMRQMTAGARSLGTQAQTQALVRHRKSRATTAPSAQRQQPQSVKTAAKAVGRPPKKQPASEPRAA